MRHILTALLATLLAGAAAAGALAQGSVPVMIGTAGPDLDACPTVGAVVGLDPRGDNFLAVRSGPDTPFVKIDEVYTRDTLWLCEKRGRWWGVVYSPDGGIGECGIGSPVSSPRPYGGACRSGWVFDRYVEITAG